MERVQVKGVYYKRVRYSDIPGCDVKTDLVCPFCDLKTPECNVVCGEGCVLKKEEPKEELYICDKAKDGCKCVGELYKPHTLMQDPHKTCPLRGRVKSIPYKEKEEPKTKRAAVIAFLDAPIRKKYCTYHVCGADEDGYGDILAEIELIDGDLVSECFGGQVDGGSYKIYKVIDPPTPETKYEKDEEVYENQDSDIASSIHYPYCWDTMAYPTLASALWEIASPVGMACSECGQAFYQPTKRETVEEVMASMPLIHSYAKDEDDRIPSDPEGYFNDMLDYYDRLKAAQDREDG